LSASENLLLQANEIFNRALEQPSEERMLFLTRACCGNQDLRNLVDQQISAYDRDSMALKLILNQQFDDRVHPGARSFHGTDRFAIRALLGSGGFGTVYEAYDSEYRGSVALKFLRGYTPDSLYRFKQEFRFLQDIRDSHLLRLFKLFEVNDAWFFTMELIRGRDFLHYVRSEKSYDEDKLRSSLTQLVSTLRFLHDIKDCLHRDLKPTNVLVTHNDRLVVLDFGLITHLQKFTGDNARSIVGTPGYMSPEQAIGGPLTRASDWFSLGVMLFEALTGKRPDSTLDIREPRELQPAVPKDLNELCRELLDPDPARRPSGESVQAALAVQKPQTLGYTEDGLEPEHRLPGTSNEFFVGRQEYLMSLRDAFERTKEGRLQIALIEGRSGIGKSTLIRHFLAQLVTHDKSVKVLSGSCYESESIPYKGVDPLIDELSELLKKLPEHSVKKVLPRDAFLLPRIFPVLTRVKQIAQTHSRPIEIADKQELRQCAFASLKDLFARLADEYTVVVWIDDLHWASRDTSTFLAELCAPPSPPRLMLILSYRSEEIQSNPTLEYLSRRLNNAVTRNWRKIAVEPLNDVESRALIDLVVSEGLDPDEKNQVAIETQGHPLFILQLSQFATKKPVADEKQNDKLHLSSVLEWAIQKSSLLARELLELVSISTEPIRLPSLFSAASTQSDGGPEALLELVRSNLIRISGSDAARMLEPYHDQVRTVVIGMLDAETRKSRHLQLANQLANERDAEPSILFVHYNEAGDTAAAHKYALLAAGQAEEKLAFDQAAYFYTAAVHLALTNTEKYGLYRKLADSLSKAGRGRDAGNAYLQAAQYSEAEETFELKRLAADQLMRSGYFDESVRLLNALLKTVGISIPKRPIQMHCEMILTHLRTKLRLLRGIPSPAKKPSPRVAIERLELLRTGGIVMSLIDPVLAGYFQIRHIDYGLRVCDRDHLAIALGIESTLTPAMKGIWGKTDRALYEEALKMANRGGNPNVIACMHIFRIYIDYLLGNIQCGLNDADESLPFLREQCTGTAWEIAVTYVFLMYFSSWAGRVRRARDLLPILLREGAARSDAHLEISLLLLGYAHYYYLAEDRPHECLTEATRALERWTPSGIHLQHWGALFIFADTYLYKGDFETARKYLLGAWPRFSKSLFMRWPVMIAMSLFLRGRVALAYWSLHRTSAVRTEIEQYAERLQGIRFSWGSPMALVLRAGLAAGEGRREDASAFLEKASEEFEKLSIQGYGSAASYFGGLLRRDALGRSRATSSITFFEDQNVRNSKAFLNMLLPGPWLTDSA